VLYDAGAQTGALNRLFSAWPRKVGVEAKLARPFDPSTLLPDTRTVFRYSGSLTTPPCTEGVLWNVMRRTMTDTKQTFEAFSRRYQINAREVWPLNDRKIE
jgi:carbonic anhydrase